MRKTIFCLLVSAGLATYGCSGDDDDDAGDAAAATSSSSSSSSSGASSGGSSGASTSSSSGASTSSSGGSSSGDGGSACEGSCAQMQLTITNGANSGNFDWGWFALDPDGLHVEVHKGGELDQCPNESSPTPDYTAVITLPTPTDAPLTRADGLTVAFLDFAGHIDDTLPPPKVTAATLTPIAKGDAYFAFDLHAEFEQGAVLDGHVYASQHCEDLDEP